MLIYVARLAAKILTLILFMLTIAAAYGGHINPYIWATPSVLTLALPYFAIATLLLTAIWALGRRFFISAAGILTIVICWSPIVSAIPFGSEKSPGSDKTFTLLTYNILHAGDLKNGNLSGDRALRYVLDSDADIVCLQEFTGFNDPDIPPVSKTIIDSLKSVYPYIINSPHTDLTLLSRFPAVLTETPHKTSRYFYDIYRLKIGARPLHIVNVHLTPYSLNEEERDVVTDIRSIGTARQSIREFKGSILYKIKESFRLRAEDAFFVRREIDKLNGAVIICGDFNDVPASYAYRALMADDLNDAYSETNFGPTFTYNKHLFLFHIDQILYKGDLKALKVERGSIDTSDHYPLLAEFELTRK